eukprot:CAMPEP_0173261886 /NCGR_PEP_ID=MMETSP1142-20121109/26457_1 /TAXON_ID=483371 /ORGANISM="non described non described, Strain CCMP2298" /LENGTH=90 /DNA_ID=CAMNT_0014196941 /DNA_START=32 /DNA_END=301 /DNA_ORIENTATION=+
MVSGAASPSPRKYMLYNAYANVSGESFDTHTNANAAVRNGRYKLLRAYVDNKSSYWYAVNGTVSYGDSVPTDDDTDDDLSMVDACHIYVA